MKHCAFCQSIRDDLKCAWDALVETFIVCLLVGMIFGAIVLAAFLVIGTMEGYVSAAPLLALLPIGLFYIHYRERCR
jgi:hypothetical protein